MSSYVITGVSRGIGYEFLRQYSSDPNNTVIGLVRDKTATDKKVSNDSDLKGRSNIHILQADITKYNDLQHAAAQTAKITGGSLDYLIANAGLITLFDTFDPIGKLADRPEEITKTLHDLFEVNVIANVHLFNLFLPLILKGNAKKVIALSSGFADTDFTNKYDLTSGSLYSASKAALNMIVAKYSAQYKADGILFLAISPGMVEVGLYNDATPEQLQRLGGLKAKFAEYAPDFKGPLTPEQSVTAVRKVIAEATIEKGNGGDFLSHYGTKKWL
ncbi:NAD(P)-binding protein [Coniochaeta sp. PMI_546]|nr:NAD(P)-binding protein [Coniochaeta sp. PMI_546]